VVHATPELTDLARCGDALREQVNALLDDTGIAARLPDAAVEVVQGEPASVLRDVACRTPGAWPCVGTEGCSAGLMRRGGTTAESLAREGPTPLLLASPGWGKARGSRKARRPPPPFARILVALSGGARDRELYAAALALLSDDHAHLAVATVIDVSGARHHVAAARAPLRAAADESAQATRAAVSELVDELTPTDVVAVHGVAIHVIAQGPPDVDLAGLADAQDIDLLVVGRGRTAARLCATTPCPTLVL
jgi:hypothetical protein